jgi:hypothetical protein
MIPHLLYSCSSASLQSNERISTNNYLFEKTTKGGRIMKTINLLICLLIIMSGVAYAQQGGSKFGPPPEAYAACKSKNAGDSASFTNPRGETITGTCQQDGNQLVLRPNRGQGQSGDKHNGPPLEAYKACEGKSAGSTAQFVNPRGETVIGVCQEENGKMVLRPNSKKND